MKPLKSKRALTLAVTLVLTAGAVVMASTMSSEPARNQSKRSRGVVAAAIVTMSALATAGFDLSIFRKK